MRYTPNLVRDEWVNIGVLVFDPQSGERRMRLIEEPGECARVRRLHPRADEELLRALRDDLENRFSTATQLFNGNAAERSGSGQASADWMKLLGKWDETLSNALQLAPQKGVHADDLDAETERLYADHVALQRGGGLVGSRDEGGRGRGSRCTGRVGWVGRENAADDSMKRRAGIGGSSEEGGYPTAAVSEQQPVRRCAKRFGDRLVRGRLRRETQA